MSEFINISAYKFVEIADPGALKKQLLPLCQSLELKGTILVSTEGINMFLAGTRESIDQMMTDVRSRPAFEDLRAKESLSDHQPFSRMLVRIKKEIISMGVPTIRPRQKTSPKIQAQQLKQWLDEGKDLTLYDVRNDYEVELGTFENAVPAGIDHFRLFPEATKQLPEEMKTKPLVMFCTGGIRCEKAGPLMEEQGFEEVYQLDGGILKYFEECGGDHYEGDCFVFDKRVAVDPDLKETDFEQCYGCQTVLNVEDQASPLYDPPRTCPHCFQTEEEKLRDLLDERDNLIAMLTTPLPGSIPYNNVRPMNVPLRFDHHSVIDFLSGMHAHLDREYWQAECDNDQIVFKGEPIAADVKIRAGSRIEHLIPHTTEPDVSNQVQFLYEDDALVAVCKPAPLPMHACGRFNRNSLIYFLGKVFSGEQLRILHRLDSNTTGVVLFARKKSHATNVHRQFKAGTVEKKYVAKIQGHPKDDRFQCDAPISDDAVKAVGARIVTDEGADSLTEFEVLRRDADGTTLVHCRPKTGRTNQIRLHLAHLGFPIVGDPTYQADGSVKAKQTLSVGDDPMCLHALELSLIHPGTGAPIVIKSEGPSWSC